MYSSSTETSPRSKNIIYPFEIELQNYLKEYESFKIIKKKFRELIVDTSLDENGKVILGISKNLPFHAFGKGRYFVLATQVYYVKSEKKCEEWFENHIGEIFQTGCNEFSKDRKIMKLALRGILNSHLIKMEYSSSKNENLSKKIEERMLSLNLQSEVNIDFVAIFKLLQNDDTSESPSISPRSPNTSPRAGGISPKILKRQFSRLVPKRVKEKQPQPLQAEQKDKVGGVDRSRAHSSPTIPHIKKNGLPLAEEKAPGGSQKLDVILEMLEEKSSTIIQDKGVLRCVKGALTQDTMKLILNEFEVAISHHLEETVTRDDMRDYLMSLYEYQDATLVFSKHPDLYKLFLKQLIAIEFFNWGLNKNKFEELIKQYHGWLILHNIPDNFTITCDKEKVSIWKLVDSVENQWILSDIAILSDPFQGYQQTIEELESQLKKSFKSFKEKKNLDCDLLRQQFKEQSQKYKDNVEFILHLGLHEESKAQLNLMKDNSNLSQICKLVLSLVSTNAQIEQMKEHRDFPPCNALRKVFESRVCRLQLYYLTLAISLNSAIEYLATQDNMKKFFEANQDKLKVLLKKPLINFEAILALFEL